MHRLVGRSKEDWRPASPQEGRRSIQQDHAVALRSIGHCVRLAGAPSTEHGQIDGALDSPDLLLAAVQRQQQPVENRLRPRRAARDVHVHRQAAVHSAGSRVAIGTTPPLQAHAPTATTSFGSGVAS